jgi:hypothetical protein
VFSVGLIILVTLGYIERILGIQLTRKMRIFLLVLFILLSAGNAIYSYYKDRNLHDQITDLSEYGEVATYNFDGYQKSGRFLFPSTPLSNWNKGYLTKRDGMYLFNCSQDSIEHYKDVINKHPSFPFPYIALSGCLYKKNDPSWKEYAVKAQTILRKTTKIPLHSADHDGWLINIEKFLDPLQTESVISTRKSGDTEIAPKSGDTIPN